MRAVAGSVDVTPPLPAAVGGNRRGLWFSTSVEPLEANACLVWSDSGTLLLSLVALDSLYAGAELKNRLTQAMPQLLQAPMWICASHTHRAPMIDTSKPLLGEFDTPYLDLLIRRLGACLEELWRQREDAQEVSWRLGTKEASHSINRRRPTRWPPKGGVLRQRVRLAPNPRGTTDETITSLECVARDGSLLAVIWNYACHPVGAPSELGVSSHFPGVVRTHLRSSLKTPKLPVLFLQGFSGDTRPSKTARYFTLRSRVLGSRIGPHFTDLTLGEYRAWTSSLASLVLSSVLSSEELATSQITTDEIKLPLGTIIERPGATDAIFPMKSISIGDHVIFLGVTAEVVSAYASWARRLASPRVLIPVGCVDDTFGYLATQEMLAEGGYEATGFCALFGIHSVRQTADEAFRHGIEQLLGVSDTTGRP